MSIHTESLTIQSVETSRTTTGKEIVTAIGTYRGEVYDADSGGFVPGAVPLAVKCFGKLGSRAKELRPGDRVTVDFECRSRQNKTWWNTEAVAKRITVTEQRGSSEPPDDGWAPPSDDSAPF